jgi:VWFA-related protein
MRCALAAAAILLAASAPAAQLNKLNVAALDGQGNPVAGLSRADFQVYQDRKRQDIAFFRFTGRAAGHPTVVLVDLLSDRMMSGSIIGREVVEALKNVESSADLYLYLLTDAGKLYPIHALPPLDSGAAAAATPWTEDIAPLLQAALKNLVGVKPVDDEDIKHRLEVTSRALRDLGSQMEEMPGRKNLVWLTHGIPLIGYSISAQRGLDFTNPVRWFCARLAQAQIVVYAVAQSIDGAAGSAVVTPSLDFLRQFTSITGGRQYASDRADDAIRQAITDARANYQVAYYEDLNPDGKNHKIRVVCARKDVRFVTAQDFYPLAPLSSRGALAATALRSRELPAEMEAAAHSPFDATEIRIRASVSRASGNAPEMDFEVGIDAADLLPGPARNPGAGKVFVAFVAFDEAPRPLPHPVLVTLTAAQLAAAGTGTIRFSELLPVPQDAHKIRVIAFDAELGALGSVTVPIRR